MRAFGWDVAELQFLLAWHGFPSGPFDGHFGGRTAGAVRRFQRFAGLRPDGVAGARTLAALHAPLPRSPLSLAWPLRGPVGSPFGPRRYAFHAGIDIVAPATVQTLLAHQWPGNVRELDHVIERAVLMCKGDAIQPDDLGLRAAKNSPPSIFRRLVH